MRRGRRSGCGLRAFVIERARGVHHGRRDRPPIVCRSPVLCTPFVPARCANLPGPARVVTSGGAGSDDAPIPCSDMELRAAGAGDIPK